MKLLFLLIISAVILAGCHKEGEVKPISKTQGSTTDTTGGSSQTPPDTTVKKYTHDDSIHFANFRIAPQAVKVSVTGTKLTMVFKENVSLLFTADAYHKTSAIHLHENFGASLLAGFSFTTVNMDGNTTLNWVDDNLNNVNTKTVTDTMINNKPWKKINVHRPFTFSKNYLSNQEALNQQAIFLATKNDMVIFSSYCYYNQKNYAPMVASASLMYSN